ncbi:glycosyltransferase family 2 protein [Microbacterium sp. W1N]|uniref:glycosyltransferase family 2 protein n=1 Tax=Microbacterium festucae TaxID=2977531 RepID=UPI0021BFFCB9|nr:glycosyltransferase family 2 protein [Microbacterium festucae]MCT9818984.1 glycosyltransferase family 2 protein [Microbacterium festucae]
MASIIIAAHDEEAVIGRCLDALRDQVTGADVIVSANGCHDRTAQIAATHGATVIDRVEPGKAAALNAAERVASTFPRVYLDADIVVPPEGLAHLLAQLEAPGVLAAVPRRRIELAGRPWPVRAYFAINERLPVFRDGLFGRGMIAVSAAGRERFDEFPTVIADDLFLDSQFATPEKREAPEVEVVVAAPRRTRDLVARLVRVRRGNAQLRAAAESLGVEVRPGDRWAWLREVVVPRPHLLVAAVPYVVITALAAWRARRDTGGWGRDESTRNLSAHSGGVPA